VNKRYFPILYPVFDFVAASTSWALFYIYRKIEVEPMVFGYKIPLELGTRFYLGLIFIPFFWLLLHYFSGYYSNTYRKSRLQELGQTFFYTLTGVIIIFFVLILDDVIVSYKNYYSSFLVLFILQFFITYIPRIIITTIITGKIKSRQIGFNTLMVGSNVRAVEVYKEMETQNRNQGNIFVGFVSIQTKKEYQLSRYIPYLGQLKILPGIIEEYNIEEVIIALETSEHEEISRIINKLTECNVIIKAIPDMYDILTGKVKIQTIFGTPLLQITHDLIPVWQLHIKRIIDILFSVIALILLFPLTIFLIIGVIVSSPGPVILSQERIGRYGKPFILYKFRSMYADAEKHGPELTQKNDKRLTPFGRFMRKRKFDEIPNFINVIKGEMSIVGPRPERQYYIDQIIKKAPHFVHLQKVKPGITSWGQVKYGYALNVDEMIKRLRYDLLYIENMSLFVDFQIMIFTLLIIIKQKNI
jgi:exopolysaccharide biosynthesis polyprenyl glycosylphosphotransferase